MELYSNKKKADLYETSISNVTPTINPDGDFGVGVSTGEKNATEIRFDDTIIICCSCSAGGAVNKRKY